MENSQTDNQVLEFSVVIPVHNEQENIQRRKTASPVRQSRL